MTLKQNSLMHEDTPNKHNTYKALSTQNFDNVLGMAKKKKKCSAIGQFLKVLLGNQKMVQIIEKKK